MAATAAATTTTSFFHQLPGLGTGENPVPLMACSHHQRRLTFDVSLLDYSYSYNLQYNQHEGIVSAKRRYQHHRRCGSASAAPRGAFYIPQPYGSDNEEELLVHPLQINQPQNSQDLSSSKSLILALSYEARRKARKPPQEVKKVDFVEDHNEEEHDNHGCHFFKHDQPGCMTKRCSDAFSEVTVSTRASSNYSLSGRDQPLSSPPPTDADKRLKRRRSTGDAAIKPVQSFFRIVTNAVESFHERHRRASSQRRISETLLTLRAARELKKLQQEKASGDQKTFEGIGSALFYPLDPQYQQRTTSMTTTNNPLVLTHSVSPDLIFPIEKEHFDVKILPEPLEQLTSNPRLLTQTMFQQLMDEGIPECLHMHEWVRIFSIDRDGDSFQTMLNHCAAYQYTILVVKTTTGHILGGFASDPWKEQDGFHERHSYYGTGLSFLFANHPLLDSKLDTERDESKELMIFKWTGDNDFCQICDLDKKTVAMGGSGAFGWILKDDFYVGSTDRCGTFGNPPLTPDKDGTFYVESMEIYGLVPYGGMFSPKASPTSVTHVYGNSKSKSVMNQGSFGQFLKTDL